MAANIQSRFLVAPGAVSTACSCCIEAFAAPSTAPNSSHIFLLVYLQA